VIVSPGYFGKNYFEYDSCNADAFIAHAATDKV
jgi:hypothetical protein